MSRGPGCAPRASQWCCQSPELSPVPALGWGAWLELEGVSGRELDAIMEFVLLSRAGAWLGHSVAAAVPWGTWLCFAPSSWTQ